MALIVDQQQTNLKHFCRICKKGFGCGRALGGHMRAHGIGDEGGHLDDDDAASDWDEKLAGSGNVPPSNKRMYALRTNPNRLRSCRACENCGKEFLSWKSFLEHGKCSSEDAESLVSSPESDGEDPSGRRGCGWSKRKRSFRAKVGNLVNSSSHICPSSEEEDLANCLMMLSNAAVDQSLMAAEPEESCASASKEEEQIRRNSINFNIAPISFRVPVENTHHNNNNIKAKGVAKGNLFECKACKKVFNSHQALGGHRASHKKVKGCFAARLDHVQLDDSLTATADDDVIITHEEFFPTKSNSTLQLDHHHGSNSSPLASTSKRKSKVHECSICHRIFSSGQALGGHKRCHWITSNAAAADTSAALAKFQQFQESMELIQHQSSTLQSRPRRPKFDNSDRDHHHRDGEALDLKLDLNLPAPGGDIVRARRDHGNRPVVVPSFEVSTEIFLQPWMGPAKDDQDDNHHQNEVDNYVINNEEYHNNNNNINNNNNNNNNNTTNSNGTYSMQNNIVDDEADSKVKLAKLSELKDMNVSEGSSPWLQVGIGSTTDVGAGPR